MVIASGETRILAPLAASSISPYLLIAEIVLRRRR